MGITIKEFATELAIGNPKDVIEKAKEIGIVVKNISTIITDEEAQRLSNYIMSGSVPETNKAQSKPQAKREKKPKEAKSSTKAPKKEKQIKQEMKNEEGRKVDESKPSDLLDIPAKEQQLLNKRTGGITIVKKGRGVQSKSPKEEDKSISVTPNIKDLFREIKQEEAEEPKVRVRKKDKAKPHTSHKQNEYKMDFERDFKEYEEENDEIVLFDLHEQEIRNEEEENKTRQAIVDRVQIQKRNKWVNEGGIRRDKKKRKPSFVPVVNKNIQNEISVPEEIRVYEFADATGRELRDVIGTLFKLGVMVTKNDFLDRDVLEILAEEFKIKITFEGIQGATPDALMQEDEDLEKFDRPPVVTIMGHVDHGKTSLLDRIRNSRITSAEAGGITQHIGAYTVEKNGKMISFIDTPGHEAFAEMRLRGAQVTDIVVIVVAADDGVKQQTIEAFNHAKNAGVQIVIAINKMDKENINPDKVKSECAELGFTPSEWGGEYDFIPLSAKTGEGIEELLENILVQAEIMELKATHSSRAKAVVLEGSLEKGRGPVATIIVQNGVLRVGDSVVVDTAFGRIRALVNDRGEKIDALYPSGVATITGLSEVPSAGLTLFGVESDAFAREYAMQRAAYLRQKELSRSTKVSLDELGEMVAKGQLKSFRVIVRADTQGSLEAIKLSLNKLNNDEISIDIIGFGVGGISESDIALASASENCVILGFNVRPTGSVRSKAKELGVEIKTYSIIYALIDDVKALMSGMMSPVFEEENTGQAEVRETFNIAKVGTIAGCLVVDGSIQRGIKVRLIRNGVVVHTGSISSLKRFKEDAREVNKGYECGIMLENFNDVRVGDVFETFKEVPKKQVL